MSKTQPLAIGSTRSLRILVVEDNLVNLRFITRTLRKAPAQGMVAENGRIAMEIFSREKFDLVFMDIQMPEMDGFEATAAIRRIEKDLEQKTPIFAMTAHVMKGFREKCLQAGMDDYIPKPVDLDQLSQILSNISATREIEEKPTETFPVFEKDHFLGRMNGDLDLCREIGRLFINETTKDMDTLQKALQEDNLVLAEQQTISIKGAASNVSATAMRQTSMKLEAALKSGDSATRMQLLQTLRSDLENYRSQFSREMPDPS